jgi:hypothetical protein
VVRNARLQSSRVRFRILLGMLLGVGAPLGWLSSGLSLENPCGRNWAIMRVFIFIC